MQMKFRAQSGSAVIKISTVKDWCSPMPSGLLESAAPRDSWSAGEHWTLREPWDREKGCDSMYWSDGVNENTLVETGSAEDGGEMLLRQLSLRKSYGDGTESWNSAFRHRWKRWARNGCAQGCQGSHSHGHATRPSEIDFSRSRLLNHSSCFLPLLLSPRVFKFCLFFLVSSSHLVVTPLTSRITGSLASFHLSLPRACSPARSSLKSNSFPFTFVQSSSILRMWKEDMNYTLSVSICIYYSLHVSIGLLLLSLCLASH